MSENGLHRRVLTFSAGSTPGTACACGGVQRTPKKGRKKQGGTSTTGGRGVNWDPECQRGGRSWVRGPPPPTNEIAANFLKTLFGHRKADYTNPASAQWACSLSTFLRGSGLQDASLGGTDIVALVRDCLHSDDALISYDFVWMVNRMRLAWQVNKWVN